MFDELIGLQSKSGFIYQGDKCRAVFAPDLGARVFCELDGLLLHRLDIENVRHPNKPFNNYGGNNFWPAPEGGQFGFNYREDAWYVPPAINNTPFRITTSNSRKAKAVKQVVLQNRFGTELEVLMEREFRAASPSEILAELKPVASFAYLVDDKMSLVNPLQVDDALLACWTLEQFEASDNTIAFVKVKSPEKAINYDYYVPPKDRITHSDNGLFYKTDSKERGQIGIRENAEASYIGFYDLENKLLCIREIISQSGDLYFNIADNEQPNGPFSAMDNYSIFNGDESLGFFELETIGGAEVEDTFLIGSHMITKTSFARFETEEPIQRFVQSIK
jgi:hypothetical protein